MGRWASVKAKRGNQETPHVALGFLRRSGRKEFFICQRVAAPSIVAPRWNRGAWRIAVVCANDIR
jgi:hypothetical protein